MEEGSKKTCPQGEALECLLCRITAHSRTLTCLPHLSFCPQFKYRAVQKFLNMHFFWWDIMSCILQVWCLVYIFVEQRTHFVKPVFSTCLASWQPGDYLWLIRLRSSLSSRSRRRYYLYSVWLAVCLSSLQYVSAHLGFQIGVVL